MEILYILLVLLFINPLYADTNNIESIVNIAGKQRMLSQRIAKDYLYQGANIAKEKAQMEMQESVAQFKKGMNILTNAISDKDIESLIKFVKLSMKELENDIQKPFNSNNAQLVLDLSETILEGSQYIVNNLRRKYKLKSVEVIDRSGQQRMLSQRIAKYYIAYQLGIKDKNTIEQTELTTEQFNKNHKFLLNYKDNTPSINRQLKKVDRLWKVVNKFYLNIKRGGLPIIVYNTTNDITTDMDLITKMYVKLYKGDNK